MKAVFLVVTIAATGLGLAIANRAHPGHPRSGYDSSPNCTVPVAVAPGYLPRAVLVISNRRGEPIRVRLEARRGTALEPTEFGTVAAGVEKSFPHALPAGRNELVAFAGERTLRRQRFYVTNRGSETCARRYVWPVE